MLLADFSCNLDLSLAWYNLVFIRLCFINNTRKRKLVIEFSSMIQRIHSTTTHATQIF